MSSTVKLLLYKDHNGNKGLYSLFVLSFVYYVSVFALCMYMYDVFMLLYIMQK